MQVSYFVIITVHSNKDSGGKSVGLHFAGSFLSLLGELLLFRIFDGTDVLLVWFWNTNQRTPTTNQTPTNTNQAITNPLTRHPS